MSVEEQNKAVVLRDYGEIWNNGRMEVAHEIVSPAFTDHPPTRFFDVGRQGPESLIQAASSFRKAFPDFHDTVETMVAEGNLVAYLGRIAGKQTGELFGFPPSGRDMSVWGINFFRFENNMIVERWGQFDVLGMMQQLGLAPAPGGPAGGQMAQGSEHSTSAAAGEPETVSMRAGSAALMDANKALYQRMVDEVVNGGRTDSASEIYAPDYVDHTAFPGAPAGVNGVGAVYGFRGGFPDVRFSVEHVLAEGDLVAAHISGQGTNTGSFMGQPPTGKQLTWRSLDLYRMADGRIKEHWGIPDLLGLMIQLGFIPAPGGAAAPGH